MNTIITAHNGRIIDKSRKNSIHTTNGICNENTSTRRIPVISDSVT